jgi:hypothetical protein
MKFHENLSSGRCGVPCGQTDMTRLKDCFAHAPESESYEVECVSTGTMWVRIGASGRLL